MEELSNINNEQHFEELLSNTDLDKLDDLTYLFNTLQQKKAMLRKVRLGDLLDKASELAKERLANNSHEFTNKEILDYIKVMQDAIQNQDESIETLKSKPINMQQNNINVVIDDKVLDKESKDRITQAVDSLLASLNLGDSNEDLKNINEIEED